MELRRNASSPGLATDGRLFRMIQAAPRPYHAWGLAGSFLTLRSGPGIGDRSAANPSPRRYWRCGVSGWTRRKQAIDSSTPRVSLGEDPPAARIRTGHPGVGQKDSDERQAEVLARPTTSRQWGEMSPKRHRTPTADDTTNLASRSASTGSRGAAWAAAARLCEMLQ